MQEQEEEMGKKKFFRPTQSPLEIPHILERITSHLGIQDIRSFRLVNQYLSEEVLRIVKTRKALWLSDTDSKEAESLIAKKLSGSTVQLSRICMSTSNKIESNELFMNLITVFGCTIRRLQITDYSNDNLTSTMFHKILTEFAPNLEEIAIHIRPSDIMAFQNQRKKLSILTEIRRENEDINFPKVYSFEWDEGCSVDLFDTCLLFPNVHKLEVSKLYFPDNHNKRKIKADVWQSLKTLNLLYLNVTPYILRFFERLQLKLETFVLSQSTTSKAASKSSSLALTAFLTSISNTLKELRITPTCGLMRVPCHLKVILPPLPELIKLDVMFQAYGSFNMLEQTPQLQKFVSGFHDPHVSKLDATRHSLIKSSNVEYASFGAADFYFIEKFSAICAKLNELWVHPSHIDNRTFRAIIVGFPFLTRLSICDLWGAGTFFSGRMADNNSIIFNDSAVTGISESGMGTLGEHSTDEEIAKKREFPFIGNLKYLKELSLEGRSSLLTDRSFTMGIKFCPLLTNISIRNAKVSQKAIISALSNNPNLKSMTANGCPLLKNTAPITGMDKWVAVDKWHLSSVCVTIDANLHYYKKVELKDKVSQPKKRQAQEVHIVCAKRSRK